MSPDELAAALHRGADIQIKHAAVDLIIGCPRLLGQIADYPDLFCVDTYLDSGQTSANIDWDALESRIDRLPLSTGELDLLLIAGSVAGRLGVAIGHTLASLDAGDLRRVLTAIAVAAGRPELGR